MPNTSVLPFVEGEAEDCPKKFKNIDNEGFEFTWDNKPFGGIFQNRMKNKIENILLANGKIDRKITYEFTDSIHPGEIVIMPKYLVNYAAMHLARKMRKREALASFQGTEREKQVAAVKIVDVEREMELQKQMVAPNFEEEIKQPEVQQPVQPVVPISTPVGVPEDKPVGIVSDLNTKVPIIEEKVKCEVCGFEAKNKFGMASHKRIKHNLK